MRNHVPFLLTLHCLPSCTQGFASLERAPVLNRIAESCMGLDFVMRFIRRCDGVIILSLVAIDNVLRRRENGRICCLPYGSNLALLSILPPTN